MANNKSKRAPAEIIAGPFEDASLLPPRVAAIRLKMLEACAKGDIEALRAPIDWNELRPLFERGVRRPPGEDPVERLKALSFDGKGREMLLLLRAVLRQSFVTVTNGPTRMYVWPAFARKAPDNPTSDARQAMLSCMRFADLRGAGAGGAPQPMEVGIGADGTWHYFWTSRGPTGGG